MTTAGKDVSAGVTAMLAQKYITYFPGRQVASVDAATRTIAFADSSSTTYDVLAYVPPHRAPQALADAGLTNEAGWIPVDRAGMQTRFANVYAVGDVATIMLAMGKPLPKAGVFAHAQAKVVAKNIDAAWSGGTANAAFDGRGMCFLEVGDGKAGIGSGDFYAEPAPQVTLKPPSWWWHALKVLFEKRWLRLLPF
jgi:sulfide:quinone oxidoreductase